MCRCELEANWTSRRTCSDLLECAEKISTITLLRWIARLISPANVRPGCTSRGAIQQRMATLSNAAQAASAIGLSWEECEIKTSCAIGANPFLVTAARLRSNGITGPPCGI